MQPKTAWFMDSGEKLYAVTVNSVLAILEWDGRTGAEERAGADAIRWTEKDKSRGWIRSRIWG